ncbi:hypothetical protein CGRA01v4_11665 [Colletotrichum graminicola]|uniref:DNA/RNA-binding protein Alba-like domain-containing protein n=1 Tax=Colletotrichum graminicola (strain M1.001 / M2 / FGSC 10212) TaxID=645133 RepID=E3QVY7_COLGM|nr:uncharacterized protein GLRG_10169 [Colletotrichum graminicola M1.001]EFQ35025.1 hypothetical protein GLRG_10169 [Colletotrichum graminicola M1.001]WDK20377.1 hypothetical protein CGRA01v4_11665 [Colletotrichum graminicola]
MAEPPPIKQPQGNKKRKPSTIAESAGPKKSRAASSGPTTPLPAHDALLASLRPKYDVLPAFTISSTKIQKRVNWLLLHLRKDDGDPRKRAVLLYARPGDVVKMITIAELVKRIVAEDEGGRWYQYNQMCELPPKADVVEETMLGGGGLAKAAAGSDDDFEVMESRFERAVLPPPASRAAKSLSVFLSLAPIPELRAKDGVTTQTNEPQGASTSTATK